LHVLPGDSSARFLAVASIRAATGTVQDPNATRRANVGPQARAVAPGKGKLGKKATAAHESAQTR
jgi:hypothetical protein